MLFRSKKPAKKIIQAKPALADESQKSAPGRRVIITARPDSNFGVENATPEAIRKEFANRLQAKMSEVGWNQSELARQVSLHMPDGEFGRDNIRSEEHTSELQSLMRISYAVFCLKKKK